MVFYSDSWCHVSITGYEVLLLSSSQLLWRTTELWWCWFTCFSFNVTFHWLQCHFNITDSSFTDIDKQREAFFFAEASFFKSVGLLGNLIWMEFISCFNLLWFMSWDVYESFIHLPQVISHSAMTALQGDDSVCALSAKAGTQSMSDGCSATSWISTWNVDFKRWCGLFLTIGASDK